MSASSSSRAHILRSQAMDPAQSNSPLVFEPSPTPHIPYPSTTTPTTPYHYPPHSLHTHICPRTTSPTVTHSLPSFGTLHHVTGSLLDANRHHVTRSPNHAYLSHAFTYRTVNRLTTHLHQSFPAARYSRSRLCHPHCIRPRLDHTVHMCLALH